MDGSRGGWRPVPRHAWSVARAVPSLLREVAAELRAWEARASAIPSPELRRQAVSSLHLKRFHCEGGAVYALTAGPARDRCIRFIVALQTISDYLDNLSDRSSAGGEPDLTLLHTAMCESVAEGAVAPDPGRFYRLHPDQDDGGYLDALVDACRVEVGTLPAAAASAFRQAAVPLVSRYCTLQVKKHLPHGREEAVRAWCETLSPHTPGLAWWEVAAATGSTLGVFTLFAAAAAGRLDDALAKSLAGAYFPHVTALHILLDYWIDQAEDSAGGDMNFARYYPSPAAGARRLAELGRRAVAAVAPLPAAGFHRTIVQGLPALYLSDPKVSRQGFGPLGWQVLRQAGPWSWFLYWTVRWLRQQGIMRPA